MNSKQVIWPNPVAEKLTTFRSDRFTPEESYDFIVRLIMETEDLLLNPVLGRTYVEEFGEFKGLHEPLFVSVRFIIRLLGQTS